MNRSAKALSFALAILLCVATNAGEAPLCKLGKSVLLDGRIPAADIKETAGRPGSERILDRFAIKPTPGGSPTSYFVSGRVVSDNTGTGIERVAIFIGAENQAPELAAMTNADGDFKFRLWIKEDQRNPRVNVPPDFSGFLYVGGYPSLTHKNVLRLMRGYSVRYKLTELKALSDLETPDEGKDEK